MQLISCKCLQHFYFQTLLTCFLKYIYDLDDCNKSVVDPFRGIFDLGFQYIFALVMLNLRVCRCLLFMEKLGCFQIDYLIWPSVILVAIVDNPAFLRTAEPSRFTVEESKIRLSLIFLDCFSSCDIN